MIGVMGLLSGWNCWTWEQRSFPAGLTGEVPGTHRCQPREGSSRDGPPGLPDVLGGPERGLDVSTGSECGLSALREGDTPAGVVSIEERRRNRQPGV
jgi:hypothetical protein